MSLILKPLLNKDFSGETRPPMTQTLAERVRAIVKDEKRRRNLSERDLANALRWSQSKVAQKLGGRTEFTLPELEAICFALDLSVVDAVRDRGLEFCADLTPTELRVIERLRQRPQQVLHAIATLLGVPGDPASAVQPRLQGTKKRPGRPLNSSRHEATG